MKTEMTILNAKRSKGDFNGKPYESLKLLVITGDDADKDNTKGLVVVEAKADYHMYNKLTDLPAVYVVDFTIRPNGLFIDDFISMSAPLKIDVMTESDMKQAK